MTAAERSLLNFLFLAAVSQRKQQPLGRDRFLALALIQACQAGYPTIAERCRAIVVQSHPHHLLSHTETAVAAMRSEEFSHWSRQLQRHCSPERAEQLALQQNFAAEQAWTQHARDLQALADSLFQNFVLDQSPEKN